jgi:hypothetical protein
MTATGGAIATATSTGVGFTAQKTTSTGEYYLNLSDSYPSFLSIDFGIQHDSAGTATKFDAQMKGAYDSTNKRVTAMLVATDTGNANDGAVHANNWIHFTLKMLNRS